MKTVDIARICILVLTALTSVSACLADDTKRLQGTWVPIQAELGGQPIPETECKRITLRIDKHRYVVTIIGEPHVDRGTFTLDAGAKPKGMTIVGVNGPNAGKTFPAIYEIYAGKVRVCYDLSGVKRPSAFKSIAGTALYLVTYVRKS